MIKLKCWRKTMMFIVHFKGGRRETYCNKYDEDDEYERDAAWDDVNAKFPDADYIEEY
jgi:hypothetical protein